ncbi:endospore germination permease [Clostridium sp. cel8]|jgi:spore germination protein (amino acid permease)|uniref:endospore germination permease n=1 Tax=unclassified Clostridium TaxID=2614128 RepID=UPI0015F353D7|nr:endospore germination permease [Clostridium sp. cel8]MBA5850075.1 endospore germination permease [Clostridium sp. cel8]
MGKFSFGHIFFLICAVSIASLKTYPQLFMALSGRDSWICSIIAFAIIVIYFDYIIQIYIKNDYCSIGQIFETAFGKYLGKFFLSIFTFEVIVSLIESMSVESNVIHTNFFLESPVWYVALFVVIPGFYVVKNGAYSIMVVLMGSMAMSTINGINLAMLTAPFKDYRRLFPVFENGLYANFFISIVKIIGMYSSIAIVIPCLSKLNKNKNARKYALISNLFIAQMILISTIGLLATFDVKRGNNIIYPKLIQTQLISFFGFIADGEFYVIFQLISSWFAKYVTAFFAVIILFKELNLNEKFLNKKTEAVLSIIIYVISCFVGREVIYLFKILDIYIYMNVVVFFILPIVTFTLFNIKNKKNINTLQ